MLNDEVRMINAMNEFRVAKSDYIFQLMVTVIFKIPS